MANDVIDTLSLEINSSAKNAYASIDALLGRLDKLNSALNGINTGKINALSTSISMLGQSIGTFKTAASAQDYTRIADGLNKIANVNFSGLSQTSNAILFLSNSLSGLNNISFDAQGLADLVNGISKLGRKTVTQATQNIPQLTTALSGLVTQLNNIGTINFDLTGLSTLVSSISKLGGKNAGLAPQNMQNIAIALKNMMATLSTAPRVSNNVIRLAEAMGRIASNGSMTGTVAKSLSSNIRSFGNSATKTEKKTRSLALSIGKLVAVFYAIKRIGKGLFDSVESSMDYLETFNYFNAAFNQVADKAAGEWQEAGYKSAEEYANSFSKRARELTAKMTGFNVADNGLLSETGGASLGMDADMLLNYQATFGQISSSMGVASENALRLSNALTMIGADLASVRNEDFSKVYNNLTSGIVGMSRAVDKYGVNIRVANLELQAQKFGISASIDSMSQADKALLRTITILDSTRYAWADLSKTINMPANQIRLLKQNFTSLSRSIGNIFLPIVAKVLPYLNAMTIALRRLFEFIGKLLGVDKTLGSWGSSIAGGSDALSDALDSIDTDVPTDGVDNLSDSLSNAKDKAKELEKRLSSWDELEVINPKQDTALDDYDVPSVGDLADEGLEDYSDILGGALDDILSEYEDAWNKAFNSLDNRAVKIANDIENAFKKLAKTAKPTTDAIKSLWNDGLKKLGSFTWDSIKDFWNNFLKPMGTWMLSDDAGLPRFFNITNDLLNEIDWNRLNSSLENFFTSLQEPAKFVWTSLMDFYEKFLKPISVWTMSEAVPQLVDALTDFNNKIKWDEINEALSNFWDAIGPFAKSVGQGLINFFKDFLSFGSGFINSIVPGGLNSIADAIKKISPETAEKIGEGIGKIALAIAGLKGLNKISQLFDKKGAIGKIFVELGKHQYFTIAAGILGVVGALDNFGIIDVDWEFLYNKFKDIKDILADFVEKIDWQTIKDGIGKFWSAFQPFAEGFAEGFIDALDKIVNGIGAPLINGIASAFEKLASALDMLPEDLLEGIGRGLGSIAAALLTIKGAKSIIGGLGGLIGAFKGLGSGAPAAGGGSLAGAGSSGAGKGLLASIGSKLLSLAKGLPFKEISGALAEGGVIGGIVLLSTEFSKFIDKLKGGNGEITELGGAVDTLTQRLIDNSAITGDEAEAIFLLKEELENAKAGTEEFSAAFIQKLSECGVSSEQLSQAVSEMGGTMNVTDEQGKFLAQTIDGLGSAAETMSGKYVKVGTDTDEAFRKIERAIMDTADQTGRYDIVNDQLLDTFRTTYQTTESVDAAYESVMNSLKDLDTVTEDASGNTTMLSDVLNQNVNSALGNLSASADTASAATSSIGDTTKDAVENFFGFFTQSKFMTAGLADIKKGSDDADTGVGSLDTTIGSFIKNLETYGTSVYEKGKTSGKNFPLGFVAGQKSKEKDVQESTQDMVDTIVDTTQDGLDEHSPSRLSYGFGENWIQGLINGSESKTALLRTSLKGILDEMARPFDAFEENFRIIGHNLMVSLANGIASVHIPLPHISVSWTKYTLGKSSFSTPNFGINYYAKGGLFTKPGLGILGEGRDDEAALPLNDTVYERIADGIAKHLPKIDIGNIEINRSQAPYVTTSNIPRSTYSNSFGEDLRKDMAAISSNTFNSNANIGQAVRDALNGMAVYADDHIIGYLREKNDESRNQNGGLGFLQV